MSEDEVLGPEDLDTPLINIVEVDPEDLDGDVLGGIGPDFGDGPNGADGLVDDLEDVLVDTEGMEPLVEEDPDAIAIEVVAQKANEDDDDDDDMHSEDDVEASLDAILQLKLVAADDAPPVEDDEDETVADDRTDGFERLQPKRPDENQCPQCFLLVRKSAPSCPVEDDLCPLFK